MCGRGEMRPFAVALTGGIGSGKSVVAAYLRENGVPVYDSDSQAKKLYLDGGFLSRIEEVLGCMLRPGGVFDRKLLAQKLFSSERDRLAVEALVHPAVLEDFNRWRDGFRSAVWRGYADLPPFVVMESALVLEKPLFQGVFDAVVAVDAPLPVRIARVMGRDGTDSGSVCGRIAAQNIDLSRADAVIVNDSTEEVLRRRTDGAFLRIGNIIRK